ncbi:MAG: hypothetical protein ABR511_09360 [Acidimicrobiales bacterium]
MATTDDEWYWCLRHGRPEPAGEACEAEQRLGPYPSEDAARHWRERVDARNEQWDAEDRRWEGDD